jgi:hypothetical protein
MDVERLHRKPVVGGHEHDRRPPIGGQLLEHLEAVELGHLDIQQDQVGRVPADRIQRGASVAALLHHFELGILADQIGQPVPGQGLVVHHQDPDPLSHRFPGWRRAAPGGRAG